MGYEVGKPPAQWVRNEAARRERHVWFVLVAVALLVALACYAGFGPHSLPIELGLAIVLLLLRRPVEAQIDSAGNWLSGGHAEESVGRQLEQLMGNGFMVMHDIEQAGEGNIDHLVSGPSGVFMIETKLRSYNQRHLTKAKRQAAKLHDELGIWVTPVICLAERTGEKPPYLHAGVWIVKRRDVVDWLKNQHNKVLPFERLARYADRL
jgi:hypothetical protein